MAGKNTPKNDETTPVKAADVENPDVATEAEANDDNQTPTLVQFRAPFEFAPPETKPQRIQFAKGRVVSSQEYDLDLLMKQGAQLDVVMRDEETNELDVVADLNAL